MKKTLITAVILFLSVIPMMYFDQGTSEGKEKTSDSTVLTIQQSSSGNVNLDKGDKVRSEPGAGIIADTAMAPIAPSAPASTEVIASAPIKTKAATTSKKSVTASPSPIIASLSSPAASTGTANAKQAEMLAYINAARAEVNLAPLALYTNLSEGAYLKSQDMAVNGYFSHYSPTYGSPFEMMTTLGINCGTTGENIAKNSGVRAAHDAFMNSPGHRANILNPEFKKIGLGFYQDATRLYVTQWFTD